MSADHRHGHGHDHDHDHDHDHGHAQAPEIMLDGPLSPGAGRGKVLYLDCVGGIAGDMTIASLLDLGVPIAVAQSTVDALDLEGVELVVSSRSAGAIGATHFDVRVSGEQTERTYTDIDALLAKAPLAAPVSELARRIFRTLAEAEARVHRIALSRVHFHEVGAVDAIVDIAVAAACFVHLGADMACSPLPMGRGFVECRHGVLPLPAPAVVECLCGVPTYDAGIDGEMVTPTGAAIVRTVATSFTRWPSMRPERIGYGRGTRDWPDRPNVVRAVLGGAVEPVETPSTPTHVIVEATVDDMTGEAAGNAVEALLLAGALDAWITPSTMKKGRPGLVFSCIGVAASRAMLIDAVLRATTTIGVRTFEVARVERPREMRSVQTSFGLVPVKISAGPYGPPIVKPEFDECAKLAREAGVPVRLVIEAALRSFASDA